MGDKPIIVVGGGLAGLSCAFELVENKQKVLLFEANEYLGGRTSNWNERGMMVESGLHRVLGFYTSFPELLEKCEIDINNVVEWINEIEITLPDDGPSAVFAISPLGKPIKSVMDLLGNNDFLPVEDKLAVSRALAGLIKDYFVHPEELDKITVVDFAKKHKLSNLVVTRILVPFTEGIFFLSPEKYSAFALASLVGPYLPFDIVKFGEGAFKGGMTDVMINPIASVIGKKGGIIKNGEEVSSLLVNDKGEIEGVRVGGRKIEAKHVVLATDLGAAKKILRKSFGFGNVLLNLHKLETMPAVTVQIELKKSSLPTDRVVFSPDTVLASYAEQTRTTFKTLSGRLSIILSQPHRFIRMNPKEILEVVKLDCERVGVDLGQMTDYRVVSHPHDFYSLTPGNEKLRPSQDTKIKGLTLAGDYTKQKYIATMEGAVVSGKLAAKNVMRHL